MTKGKLPTIETVTLEQTKDEFHRKAKTQVGTSTSEFQITQNRLLVRASKIDGCLQKLVSVSLGERNENHNPAVFGNASERRWYDTMRMELFLPHTASDINQMVCNCESCARNCVRFKWKWYLQMSPTSGLPTFTALEIPGPLPGKTTSTKFGNVFLGRWLFPYGLPDHLLTENGLQFLRRLFAKLCGFPGLEHLTPTANHDQLNFQVWRNMKTTVTPL